MYRVLGLKLVGLEGRYHAVNPLYRSYSFFNAIAYFYIIKLSPEQNCLGLSSIIYLKSKNGFSFIILSSFFGSVETKVLIKSYR